MAKKLKEIPEFETEDEERTFWSENDSCDYFDWSQAEFATFPNLKPTLSNDRKQNVGDVTKNVKNF